MVATIKDLYEELAVLKAENQRLREMIEPLENLIRKVDNEQAI